MRFVALWFISLLIIACNKPTGDNRPNILLIVADDLGYSDLGCFGGEIHTPNIDGLARSGIRFSQFHTSPYCAPTRAMLLTGQNNHVAGMGNQGGAPEGSAMVGVAGYEGHLSDRVMPFPEVLRANGYHTLIAGKWHLGTKAEHSPARNGFERSFCLLQGGGNHFNNIGIEQHDSISLYRDGENLVNYPEGKYSTELYTDKLIQYINEINDDAPFFAYAAYTSPHWPLQVPEAELNMYMGKYNMGYDSLRTLRFNSLKKAGIIPADQAMPDRLESIKPWTEPSDDERKAEARKMELYAAMVENLDSHVGRLLKFLKEKGLYENTVIVFMSDNGAAGEDFYNTTFRAGWLQERYNNALDNMGKPTSFVSYGPQWAVAGVAAYNRHKSYTTEGGVTTPMIMSGRNIPDHGGIQNSYLTVMDLAPTFFELAKIDYATDYPDKPLAGQSLLPFLKGQQNSVHNNEYLTALEHRGRVLVRKGNWKIVQLEGPYDESKFMLFDLDNDPAETRDVRWQNPKIFQELLNDWNDYVVDNHINIIR